MKEASDTKLENPPIFKLLPISTSFPILRLLLIIAVTTDTLSPIFKLPPIPTPPTTLNAPVFTSYEGVLFSIITFPLKEASEITFIRPATFVFPPIPTPPATTKAPVAEDVEVVLVERIVLFRISVFPTREPITIEVVSPPKDMFFTPEFNNEKLVLLDPMKPPSLIYMSPEIRTPPEISRTILFALLMKFGAYTVKRLLLPYVFVK